MKVGAALLVSLVLSACASAPTATRDPVADIQRLLDDGLAAIGKADSAAFDRTLDPDAPAAFWRMQRQRFADGTTYGAKVEYKVVKVEPYLAPYSRVWIEVTDSTPFRIERVSYKRSYVRSADGHWLLTEPPVALLGGEKVRSADGIDVRYWGIDEDVIGAAVPELAASRRDAIAAVPPFNPSSTWTITLYPTAETAGPGWAWPMPAAEGNELSFSSIGIGFTSSLDRWGKESRFLAHWGALTWAREQVVPGTWARLFKNDWWLWVGWPEALASTQVGVTEFYKPACAGVGVRSLQQLRDGPPGPGTPGWTAEVHESYVLLARSMIEYLLATYGPAKYWDLLREFIRDVNTGANFSKVLGTSPERFYTDSLSWAKKKYC
jgi:hypothetical protein